MKLVPLTPDYELTPFDCGPFYEKNGFKALTKKEEDEHTRLMFYDMMEVS